MLMKAFTMSYDDGVFQDRRLVHLMNKYGIKATFNLNSGLIQKSEPERWTGERAMRFYRNRVPSVRMIGDDLPELYKGHEVAIHGVDHILLKEATKEETFHELVDDKVALSEMFGYNIEGGAYPYGPSNEFASEILKQAGIKYCRAAGVTGNFDPSDDMYYYVGTAHHADEKLFDLAKQFIELKADKPQIFYVWGHSYEFDLDEAMWERIEEFFKLISGRDDIYYGTNIEVFKYFDLV